VATLQQLELANGSMVRVPDGGPLALPCLFSLECSGNFYEALYNGATPLPRLACFRVADMPLGMASSRLEHIFALREVDL